VAERAGRPAARDVAADVTAWPRRALAVIAVALIAAGCAIAFRASLAAASRALGGDGLVAMVEAAPAWRRAALPAAAGLVVGLIALAAARVRQGAGVGFVIEAIVLGRVRVPLTRTVLQGASAWLAIASGASLGREGPLLQFGAAAGEAARRALGLDDDTARVALAAGVAAGFAAAYNAPLAAILFVVEIVTGVMVLEVIAPMVIAVVIATLATRAAIGEAPLYGVRALASTGPAELVAFAGLGAVAAPLGVGFLRLLAMIERAWRAVPVPWRPAAGGAACGALVAGWPLVAGNGLEPLAALLDGKLALAAIAGLIVVKPLATALAVGSGNPGGVFTPTLLIGGAAGALYGAALHAGLGDAVAAPATYALVGAAAALAATTHAPLTAAVLACELSADYALLLPLLVACAIAAALARRLHVDSVYTAELSRRGVRWRLTLDGRREIDGAAPGLPEQTPGSAEPGQQDDQVLGTRDLPRPGRLR
jgi:chloride channel protein, CIC family